MPLLLSGLAYPPPALPPASVPGNAMEAVVSEPVHCSWAPLLIRPGGCPAIGGYACILVPQLTVAPTPAVCRVCWYALSMHPLVRCVVQGYCWHFGAFWSPSSSEPLERQLELMDNKYTAYSPSIKWLLRGRGFPVPTTQQQSEETPTNGLLHASFCARALMMSMLDTACRVRSTHYLLRHVCTVVGMRLQCMFHH